jgi:hypothetical protein
MHAGAERTLLQRSAQLAVLRRVQHELAQPAVRLVVLAALAHRRHHAQHTQHANALGPSHAVAGGCAHALPR